MSDAWFDVVTVVGSKYYRMRERLNITIFVSNECLSNRSLTLQSPKVWFVHDHEHIEEDTSSTVRARIIHYNDMVSKETLHNWKQRADATHGTSPQSASKNFYDVGPTDVGYWTCTPGSFAVTTPRPTAEGFYVLEGVFFLTNHADGNTQRCVAGDTVVLPKGWTGEWNVVETVQKLWVEV